MLKTIKKKYNAIIVGAGPAGLVCAYNLAKSGLSVLILEKDREIGLPVRCGEIVGKLGIEASIIPKKEWIMKETSSVVLVAPDKTRVTIPTPHSAYTLDRSAMEKGIANMAAEHGADILTGSCAVELLKEENKVVGLEYLYQGKINTVMADIIVGADGVESRMAKLAGLKPAIADLRDIGICAQYLAANIPENIVVPEFYFGKELLPNCYAWVFPKGNGTANIGLGILGSEVRKNPPGELLDIFIKTFFPDVKPLYYSLGGVPLGSSLKELTMDGFLAIGDAARQVNNLDGAGIAYGMEAGKIAAEAIVIAIEKGECSKKNLASYPKKWKAGTGKKQVQSNKLKDAVLKVEDDTINKAAKQLLKKTKAPLTFTDVFKAVLLKQPSLILEAISFFK